MRTKIKDVAKEAGVSVSTVSRVINNNYPVSKETREKVEFAIKKLNFEPNYLAKSLSENKSYVIGVLVPSINNLFFTEIVSELEKRLIENKYMIYLLSTNDRWEQEKIYLNNMLKRQVDGLILINSSAHKDIHFDFLNKISPRIPMIMVNGRSSKVNSSKIISNQEHGAKLALEYLYNTVGSNISIFSGENSFSYEIKEKVFKDFFFDKDIPIKEDSILRVPTGNTLQTIDYSRDIFLKSYKKFPHIKGIFTFNDLIALGILQGCQILNINVPKDISIISHDNTILSSIASVKLSTVDLKLKKIGYETYKLIYKLVNAERITYETIKIDTELILRDSTI